MKNKIVIMDIFESVTLENLDNKNESVLFNVIDTETGDSTNNFCGPVYANDNGIQSVYFGERLVPLSKCEFFMAESIPNDDWERNMRNKIPDENEWTEYTPFRRIIFRFLKDKYDKIGTMYCNEESWRKIRSTFTELNIKGEETPDLTMARLETFLNELSVSVSSFFDVIGPIARRLFPYDLLDEAEKVVDTTNAFTEIDVFNEHDTYHLLTSILIKALYGNVQYKIVKAQVRRLRSILMKLPKDKDITFTRFKATLETFNIRYTDVLCNMEKFKGGKNNEL